MSHNGSAKVTSLLKFSVLTSVQIDKIRCRILVTVQNLMFPLFEVIQRYFAVLRNLMFQYSIDMLSVDIMPRRCIVGSVFVCQLVLQVYFSMTPFLDLSQMRFMSTVLCRVWLIRQTCISNSSRIIRCLLI